MSRRLQVLFLVALLGVLAMVGAAIGGLTGPAGVVAYAVVVLALVGYLAARARAVRPAGRTCDCCTSTVHDPVRVR